MERAGVDADNGGGHRLLRDSPFRAGTDSRLHVGVCLDRLVPDAGADQLPARPAESVAGLGTWRLVAHAAIIHRRRDLRRALGILERLGLHQMGIRFLSTATGPLE